MQLVRFRKTRYENYGRVRWPRKDEQQEHLDQYHEYLCTTRAWEADIFTFANYRARLHIAKNSDRIRLQGMDDNNAALSPGQTAGARKRVGSYPRDELFRSAPIPILVEDWSKIKLWIDSLKARGVKDLPAYLDEKPSTIEELRMLHAVVDANDATLALFDADSREVFLAWSQRLLPASRVSNTQVLHAMFEGRASCQGERTLATLNGKTVPIIWKCSLPDDDEGYRRLHFYAFDVTEQRENHIRLEALRAQISRTARASLVGQLAASITHEIGQPLGAIRSTLDAAVRWLDRAEPNIGEALTAFRYASRWTDDMSAICQRLRGFLAGTPVKSDLLDCAEVTDSVIRLVTSEAHAHAISLTKEVERGVQVYADRVQVQQVLTNLLVNGIHAIAGSNGVIRKPLLIVGVRRHDDMHSVFEVTDNGPGMTEAQQELIFQPFASTKTNGMGMGLPISRSIVEAHGGTIWLKTTSEAGTTFCFTLPSCASHISNCTDIANALR